MQRHKAGYERMKKSLKKIWYVVYIVLIVVVSMEIILRVYYPFQRKTRGDKWKMPVNVTYTLKNDFNQRLDSVVFNKRNSIGFRGADPPPDINDRLSILAVGGSTTACTFLNEGKTWVDELGVSLGKRFAPIWINNAGIDGHSSYGHLNFMHYYLPTLPFRPKLLLFLVGANDVDRDDIPGIDSSLNKGGAGQWISSHSETIHFLQDLKWAIYPPDIFTDKQNWNFTHFKEVKLDQSYVDAALNNQQPLLKNYKERLTRLIESCEKLHIDAVLITQPLLFGDGTPQGGNPHLDLHAVNKTDNGRVFWLKLQLYNEVTKQVAAEKRVHCIDLASLMPKDTTYFYDMVHYTNAGAQKLANIISDSLNDYIARSNARYIKN
jgi:lysophospholipase L1-like esterase